MSVLLPWQEQVIEGLLKGDGVVWIDSRRSGKTMMVNEIRRRLAERAAAKPTTIMALPHQPIQPLRGLRRIGVMLDDAQDLPIGLDTGDAAVHDHPL